MKTPEDRLIDLDLLLPEPIKTPKNFHLPFAFVNIRGSRVFISGHPRQSKQGNIDGPYGVVGKDLTTKEAQSAAQDIALSVLANLKQEIGDLSNVIGWNRVLGMVNSDTDYTEQHLVLNGFSDLIIKLFGEDIGRHSRSAVGVNGLPMNFAIEIEAELEIK